MTVTVKVRNINSTLVPIAQSPPTITTDYTQPVLGDIVGYVSGIVYSTSNTTSQPIDAFAIATYRSADYLIQAKDNTNSDYHMKRAIIFHDGVDAYITEYANAVSNTSLMTLSTDIFGGNLRLNVVATTANTTFKITRTITLV